MSRFKVLDELPNKRYGRNPHDWTAVLDVAMEHEGKWIEASTGTKTSSGAHYRAKSLRVAAQATADRLGLKRGFQVAVRQPELGAFAVYVRKLNGSGGES